MTGINPCTPCPGVHLLGDAALVIDFGAAIDPLINARVLAAAALLRARRLEGVLDLVPAWSTLTVLYDACRWDATALGDALRDLCAEVEDGAVCGALVEIPVCYADEFAPDMALVCAHTGLSSEAVVARHAAAAYRVYFLGFTPGFPYLGGLDPALAVPRRATPRTRVPAGSVAIGGQQTGVYPMATPGGWQLIGRTALPLFDAQAASPCRLAPGDTVRFVPVSAERMRHMLADEGGA